MKFDILSYAKQDKPMIAIVLLLVGTFTLGFQDSLIKLMSSETSFWQIQTLRSASNLLIVLLLAVFAGGVALIRARNWIGVYLRALFLVICMFFFFSGSPFLTMAQMAVGLYTYPLFVCAMATPVLGETIGRWRIGSMALGTLGAILALSPWHQSFSPVQLLPVIAGFFYACNILTLRRVCRHESTLALAFAAGLVYFIFGVAGIALLTLFPPSIEQQLAIPFVTVGWPAITGLVVGFALFASALNLLGNICMTRAYQTADASLLAPLDFTYLLFAAFWGKVLFDKWPSHLTVLGMGLIICAGVIIAWRERIAAAQQ